MSTIPPFEMENVIDIYNDKCKEFDVARYTIWTEVQEYITSLAKGSSILEVGCGNGKNMCDDGYVWTGCDASEKLVSICIEKGLNAHLVDACNLPYKDDSFDAVMSVAMIHHLSTIERRIQAMSEMYRVLKPGGTCFVTMVKASKSCNKTFKLGGRQRYYHLFEKEELDKLITSLPGFRIISISSNRLNWFYLLKKTYV